MVAAYAAAQSQATDVGAGEPAPVLALRGLYRVSDTSLSVFKDQLTLDNQVTQKWGYYSLKAGEQYVLVADVINRGGGLKKLFRKTVWTSDVSTSQDVREFDLNNPRFFVYGWWWYPNPVYSPHSAILIYFELWAVDNNGAESNHIVVGPVAAWN